MKKIVPVLVILALAGGAAVWAAGRPETPQLLARYGIPDLLHLSTPRETGLVLYGNVDIREVSLGFRVAGRIDELLVDEGDSVKAGDVIARLDKGSYEFAARAAEEKVNALAATLAKLKVGARATEIDQARAAYNEQRAGFANAQLAYDRARQLRSQGTIAQAALDQSSAERDVAAARVESARAALALLQQGTRTEDIAAAEAQLAAARAELEAARTSLADIELKAPSDGVVLSRVEEKGAIVGTANTVFVLALSQPLFVRSYVAEPDLGRLHPGQKAKVTTDGPTGASYLGTVGFISPVAEFTPKSVETPDLRTDLVYRLRVVIDEPGPDLRQGMPVTIRFAGEGAAP